ncbi:MAG: biopolymer transporter ExbD [Bacteroidales bacterium]|nr:biopolymer transporter ExbD [Bacteroidales bacterium]MDD2204507.1 biopolymer transporter ExbD [Bacteroidales bacterium]MDD3151427.1 biopolymer transporter ExbD [Bacteroidales bacterium]MDD3914621.1 biopolymer transporter ExbD [Bacteroidales bacterium]MDD4633810.1 biopolymer transporter ExbD [Bacteroidales bacterium]
MINRKEKKKVPAINASSMADISFLLLAFFLMTTTMEVDTGIARRLPPPVPPTEKPPDIKERNILKVNISKNDRILINDKIADVRMLKDQAKEFLSNPYNREDLPEKRWDTIPALGGLYEVSKGIISLKNDRGTSYEMYIKVQDELTKAVNELRDELSRREFGISYMSLKNDEQLEAVRKAVPISISEAEPEEYK